MSPEKPRKRHLKIALACTTCRDRKIRCDGAQPVCGACTRRNASKSCQYKRASTVFRRQYAPNTRNTNRQGTVSLIIPPTTSLPFGPQRSSHISDPVDGLGTVGTDGDDQYPYGQSSTIAFLRQVGKGDNGMDDVSLETEKPRFNPEHLDPTLHMSHLYPSDERSLVLPQRAMADNFLKCFWTYIHPIFPILHKTSFMRSYGELWRSKENANDNGSHFTSMLNLVFALGCQYSDLVAVSARGSTARDFYLTSRRAFTFDILDSASITHVQLLLLMGVYLQSSRYASQCWNAVGLAIRSAQGLGLHLEREESGATNQIEREMARRVWYNCVCLDRLLSMTFGRPPVVTATQVSLPKAIDDDFLKSDGEGYQPPETPSYLGSFVSSCRLFEILKAILDTFYTQDMHGLHHREIMITSALAFNRRLGEFHASIPECLRIRSRINKDRASKESSLHLQQQVLYCRFLYTRVLSLRPLLLVPGDQRASTSLDNDILRSCCALCVDSAQELIETIYANLDTLYRSSGWHSVYFTFAAATVLLAGAKFPATDMISTDLVWSKGLLILEHYKDQIASASKAIEVLRRLRRQTRTLRSWQQAPLQMSEDVDPGSQLPTREPSPQFSQFNPYAVADISDAWFGQQFLNFDWLDLDPSPVDL